MTHDQAPGQQAANERRLLIAALLIGSFMVAEVVGGLLSGSLALLADAGHSLADFAALFFAWLAFRFSRWPADGRRSFGFGRLQILAAYTSGLSLLVIAGMISVEAVRRLNQPVEVLGGLMLVVAVLGAAINLGMFLVLHGTAGKNLNIRAAIIHVLGDLMGSLGTIVAAVIILTTGWMPADPLISLVVATLIARSGWGVVRESGHILLEGAPRHLSLDDIERDLEAQVQGIADIHHVHAWSLTEEQQLVTLHARLCPGHNPDAAVRAIKSRLADRFGIAHVTVEIEHGQCADGRPPDGPASANK